VGLRIFKPLKDLCIDAEIAYPEVNIAEPNVDVCIIE